VYICEMRDVLECSVRCWAIEMFAGLGSEDRSHARD
jgi:hypothetical protein